MPLSRNLYSTQFLTLQLTEGGDATDLIVGLPVQTASIERTVPTEDVLVLGKLGSAGRQQKEVESVKVSVKLFWSSGERDSATATTITNSLETRLTAANLSTLTGNALLGTRSKIMLSPNGFTGYGILTNFGIEAGVGDFLTANLSFEGFGTPVIATAASAANVESDYAPKSVYVYTTENVSAGGAGTETIKSAKFSIDIPTERLTRLGAPITGLQTDTLLTGSNLIVAKPPFKVSVSYDGELVTGAHANDPITFGHLKVTPIGANITSQSYNQNAGDVGAAFSFSSEGTSCSFETP